MTKPFRKQLGSVVGSQTGDSRLVTVTDSTVTLTKAKHDGKVIVLNRAAGIAVTLPAATGSGCMFKIVVGTTVTSNTTTIKVVGNDIMQGSCIQGADGGNTVVSYDTASDSDTITLNGSTTGGLIGEWIELIDMKADTWMVHMIQNATGSEATPFSATVS